MNSISYEPETSPVHWVRIELPERRFRNAATRALDTLSIWQQRSRQRRQLTRLDDRLLTDIGVSYEDVWVEINKPFWKK